MKNFNLLLEEHIKASYDEYTQYVKEQLAQKAENILSYHDWAMENDEDYRDEVLDSDDYYKDTWEDTTDQERFDDELDMYDIAGING